MIIFSVCLMKFDQERRGFYSQLLQVLSLFSKKLNKQHIFKEVNSLH
jgi:hypothetical protein